MAPPKRDRTPVRPSSFVRPPLKWQIPKITVQYVRGRTDRVPAVSTLRDARDEIVREYDHHARPQRAEHDLSGLHVRVGVILPRCAIVLLLHLLIRPVLGVLEVRVHVALRLLGEVRSSAISVYDVVTSVSGFVNVGRLEMASMSAVTKGGKEDI